MQGMEAGGHEHAEGNAGALIGRYIIYLPLAGFLVNLVIALAGGADDWKVTSLKVGLTWLVGVSRIALGTGHLFLPVRVAASTGRCSPSTTSRRAMLAPSLLITL